MRGLAIIIVGLSTRFERNRKGLWSDWVYCY